MAKTRTGNRSRKFLMKSVGATGTLKMERFQ